MIVIMQFTITKIIFYKYNVFFLKITLQHNIDLFGSFMSIFNSKLKW